MTDFIVLCSPNIHRREGLTHVVKLNTHYCRYPQYFPASQNAKGKMTVLQTCRNDKFKYLLSSDHSMWCSSFTTVNPEVGTTSKPWNLFLNTVIISPYLLWSQ